MTQRRFLIIRPDRIGDVVLTTPLIRAVKKSFPGSFVAVMVGSYTAPLLEHNPHIDLLLTDDPEGKDSARSGFWHQVVKLRQLRFDTGLMPLPRERHAWMMLLAGVNKRIGVGTKLYQVLTGMKTVSRHKYIPLRHEADYVMDLGRRIGITTDDLKPEIFVPEEEKIIARQFFTQNGFDISKPIIGINPGSNSSSPNWPPEKYSHVVKQLSRTHQVFVNVGPKSSNLEKHFNSINSNIVIHAPDNLRDLIGLCSLLSVLVAPSTGTMHIAAALGIPTVSLFCPLTACSPKLWGPIGNSSEIILPPEGYCQGRCPGNPKICPFEEITVDEVVLKTISLVKNKMMGT
ncbi:MAG: glycosyltransferase family 9 protein [Bacteroidota bacterium]|nr:glycosyltransferase family 9 protein [Bacteroidota bacterium]